MSVKELETAVAQLSPEELAQFAEWFEDYHNREWDTQSERDLNSGETALRSQAALAVDWDRPEEDKAWAHLQP